MSVLVEGPRARARLFRFAPPDAPGFLNGLDPGVRLLAALAFALAVVSVERLPALIAALAAAVVMAALSGAALRPTLRRLAALDGFVIAAIALLPFTTPGEPLFALAGFPLSREGALRAVEILIRANAVALMMFALLGAIEPGRLGLAMTRLGAPEKLVRLFLFTLRYVDVIRREQERLRLAMKARGFVMRCDRHTWRSMGHLLGMMLARSLDRSERIVAAMRCRGFTGRFPAFVEPQPIGRADRAFAVAALGACLALAAFGRL